MVGGSNPLAPTKSINQLRRIKRFEWRCCGYQPQYCVNFPAFLALIYTINLPGIDRPNYRMVAWSSCLATHSGLHQLDVLVCC
ncbi:MAG: hypothetical protein WAU04_10515, partial [Candidatus Nitrotoga sp.]